MTTSIGEWRAQLTMRATRSTYDSERIGGYVQGLLDVRPVHRFAELQVLGNFGGALGLEVELSTLDRLVILPVDQNLLRALLIESLRLMELMDQLHAFFRRQMARRNFQRVFNFAGRDRKTMLQFLDSSIGFRRLHREIRSPYRREIRIVGIALVQFLRDLETLDHLRSEEHT